VRPLRDKVMKFVKDDCLPFEDELRQAGRLTGHSQLADDAAPGERKFIWHGLRDRARELGLWAPGHPKEYGGGGLPFFDYAFINEAIGQSHLAIFAMGTATLQTFKMIDQRANEYWKKELLQPLVDGDIEIAYAMTEPDVASSDPTQLQTRA